MKSVAQRLTRNEVKGFKEKLEQKRREAREFLRNTEEEQKGLDVDRPPELGDFCVESATREYLFERASQQRRLLNRIDRALQKIDAGTFGTCLSCGNEIQRKRLTAVPWTEYCLHCQDERERQATSRSPTLDFSPAERVTS